MLGIFPKAPMDWEAESGVAVIGEAENGAAENAETLTVLVALVTEDVVMTDCFAKL